MTQLPPQGPGHHDLENLIFLGRRRHSADRQIDKPASDEGAIRSGPGAKLVSTDRERQGVKHMGEGGINGDRPSC